MMPKSLTLAASMWISASQHLQLHAPLQGMPKWIHSILNDTCQASLVRNSVLRKVHFVTQFEDGIDFLECLEYIINLTTSHMT